MGLDKKRIQARLDHLEECLDELSGIKLESADELMKRENFMIRRTVERCLYLAIQDLLDIGAHIISAQGLGVPADYRDVIAILGNNEVIPSEFAKRIEGMAGFRSILEHDYVRLDLQKVFENFQRLDDFRQFARHIVDFVEGQTG